MASSSLGTLTLDLIAKTGGFVQGMTKAERSSARWRKQVKRDMQQIGKAMRVVGAGAVAAAGAFGLLVRQGLESIDAQAKMARQLGVSIDGLRALTEAGEDAGVSTEVMQKAMERFNARLGEARRGTGQAFEALERLGLSASALSNMDADERMATLADRMKALGMDTQQAADVLRQFGIRNGEVTNLLLQGGDAIRASRSELEEYGLTLSSIDAGRIEAANDAMRRIGRATEALRNQLTVALAPAILTVSQGFNAAAKESKGFSETATSGVENLVASVGFVVDSVEGLKRTFEVTGAAIAVIALQTERVMMKLGESIIDQPVKSINFLIEGLNKISPIDIEPVGITQLSKDIDRELALLEGAIAEGKKDIHDILMKPLPSAVFGAALEQNRRLQAGRDAGLGMEGGLNSNAIAAAVEVSEGLKRLRTAANDAADSLDKFNPSKNQEIDDILDRAGEGSSIDAAGQIRDAWGNTLPTLQRELDAELKRQVADFQSAQNLSAGLKAAAQSFVDGASTAAKAAWASIQPKSADDVAAGATGAASKTGWSSIQPQSADDVAAGGSKINWSTDLGAQKVGKVASQVSGGSSATGGRNLGTLTLKSEEGGSIDVQGASDQLTKWLADTLSGVAAGSR